MMEHSQEKVIQKTKKPISKKEIIKGLKTLGLHKNSKVEVHTSLSSFGYIINKEYDIIDSLLEVIQNGVILMPAHTSEYTDPTFWENPAVPENWVSLIKENRRAFDKDIFIPERIGSTPIAFLRYPGVERTNHPFISLGVYNQTDDPSWIEHSLNEDDDINPLLKLSKEGGKILFLGTDFQTCTSIHVTERFCNTMVKREDTVRLIEDGKIVEKMVRFYDFDDDIDRFDEIAKRYIKEYENTPYYKQVKIGLATCTLIDAEALYDISYDFHINHKKITSN
jgi:aminoglycoside 3-N-acetyltransferase